MSTFGRHQKILTDTGGNLYGLGNNDYGQLLGLKGKKITEITPLGIQISMFFNKDEKFRESLFEKQKVDKFVDLKINHYGSN